MWETPACGDPGEPHQSEWPSWVDSVPSTFLCYFLHLIKQPKMIIIIIKNYPPSLSDNITWMTKLDSSERFIIRPSTACRHSGYVVNLLSGQHSAWRRRQKQARLCASFKNEAAVGMARGHTLIYSPPRRIRQSPVSQWMDTAGHNSHISVPW